jgi:C1A family cysteine protease
MDNAFKYFETNFAELEAVYPYTAKKATCTYDATKATKVEATTYADVPSANMAQLHAAIAKQPVSVAIEADKPMFRYYASGVLDSPSCGTTLDHGVLAVGYGVREDGIKYYTVKNSWNTTWGDKGYIKLRAVEGAGTCGI